jgi:S1-C subfamily serine protease
VPVTVVDGQIVVGFDQSRLEQLIAQAQKEKPVFGAAVADAVRVLKGKSPLIVGAYVGKVKPDSIAEKLGLKPGDIIIQMNIERIAGATDFEKGISNLKPGSSISLVYIRDNTVLTNEVVW